MTATVRLLWFAFTNTLLSFGKVAVLLFLKFVTFLLLD